MCNYFALSKCFIGQIGYSVAHLVNKRATLFVETEVKSAFRLLQLYVIQEELTPDVPAIFTGLLMFSG